MGTVYLVAAGLTGAIVGYTIARFESRFETRHVESSHSANVSIDPAFEPTVLPIERIETVPPARVVSTGIEKQTVANSKPDRPPVDDLELAARRFEQRARTADRLGDPKLAELWRNEAAKLREAANERLAETDSKPD